MKRITPSRLNLIIFIITLFLSITVKLNPPVWTGFSDPYDYLHQSNIPLSDKNFYFPQKTTQFSPRPFTVPLFYKIANSNPDTIILMQILIHSVSTFYLCYVVLLLLTKTSSKITFIVFWYLLMSWWNILGWAHTLLSESLSISLMFLWIASFLHFYHTRKVILIAFHIIIMVLFSFTRDSWPYVIILFYAIFTFIAVIWDKKVFLSFLSFFIISVSVFFVQQKSAEVGQRYCLPIINNIVLKILPDDDYLLWFHNNGMPSIPELKKKYSNMTDKRRMYSLYKDSTLSGFFDWIANDGKTVYTKFLLTHPSFSFLLKEKPKELNRIFAYNVRYSGSVYGYSWISQFIFPLFNTITIILLNGLLIFLFLKERKFVWIFPSAMILVFTFNAFLLYNADALEVERHLFITNIVIQFIGILLVSFLLDSEICNPYIDKLFKKNKKELPHQEG